MTDLKEITPPTLPRRKILKNIVATAAIVAAAVATTKFPEAHNPVSNPLLNLEPVEPPVFKRPEGLPSDVLTSEELQAANITVNNTADVQLYIRRAALSEMKIFQDAEKGNNGGVEISLVADDNLNWAAIDKLPPEPRLIWQAGFSHPSEWPEKEWSDWNRYLHEYHYWLMDQVREDEHKLTKIENGQIKTEIQNDIDIWTRTVERTKKNGNNDNDLKEFEYYLQQAQQMLADYENGKLADDTRQQIKEWEEKIEVSQQEMLIVKDNDKRSDYFAGRATNTLAQFIDLSSYDWSDLKIDDFPTRSMYQRRKYLKDHPELREKVYIYLAVSGEQEPRPQNSYPGPSSYIIDNFYKEHYGYHIRSTDEKHPIAAGFSLRHEIGHYMNDFADRVTDEAAADTYSFETITQAWERNKSGDNTGYYFIFNTKNGLIFTKKPEPLKPPLVF